MYGLRGGKDVAVGMYDRKMNDVAGGVIVEARASSSLITTISYQHFDGVAIARRTNEYYPYPCLLTVGFWSYYGEQKFLSFDS